RKRKFTTREVMRILHDVVDALSFAHERGVIHRDIKPANILTQGAHALVADFGVAKALSAAMPLTGVTTTGIAIGPPAYISPEQQRWIGIQRAAYAGQSCHDHTGGTSGTGGAARLRDQGGSNGSRDGSRIEDVRARGKARADAFRFDQDCRRDRETNRRVAV